MKEDIKNIVQSDKYLSQDLNPEEQTDFEQRLKHEEELREDLQHTKKTIEGIKGFAFKQQLKTYHEEHKKTRGKVVVFRILSGIAASVIIVIGFLLYTTNTHNDYSKYFIPYPSPINVRSESDRNYPKAMDFYDREDYAKAIAIFQSLPLDQQSEDVQFYYGISLLANGEPDKAINVFAKLGNGQYKEESAWYLGLAYLMAGQDKKGAETLQKIKPGEYQYDHALKILNQLQ